MTLHKNGVYAVYEATKLILEDPKNMGDYNGIGPTDVQRTMLPNFSVSYVSACMRQLLEDGYIVELPESKRTKRLYMLTDKELLAPDSPTLSEDILEKDINELIDNLEKIQDLIPKVLFRLLDVSRSLGKFRKLKELLTNASSIARTNL